MIVRTSYREAVALAMTGASGAQYGLRLLDRLLAAGERVYLMLSKPAQVVIGSETDLRLPGRPHEIARYLGELYGAAPGQLSVFGQEEWTAPVASGSATSRAMVVCPCSMGTVASLAQGASRTLIERAGDVMLKERRPLIVVPRETPFSTIHLENLLRLAQAGALILPANPGFYHRPSKAEDLVDYIVARILDHLGVGHCLGPRWGVDGPAE
jgi:4-hydroxy-3-polyprenylbenzoate decarboxylase